MEDFQFQINYRDKTRQFYLPGECETQCDYSKLVENIVTNISSLFGQVFQIQFLNDEAEWITLSENVNDIRDMFRCARPIATFRRIKLKIIEGCSPAAPKDEHSFHEGYTRSGSDSPPKSKKAKRLDFEEYLTAYKTPIDIDINNKKEEVESLEIRLDNYEEEYERVLNKFSGGSTRVASKTGGKQCGKCHLFQNHRKNNCPNDTCVSAVMCGDVQKHPEECGELREIADRKNKLALDLKKAKQELELKTKVKEKLNSSFEKRLEPHLIDTNRKKYLAETAFGIRPRQALLNEDIAILERHYRGVFPRDINFEKRNFQQIISRANEQLCIPKKPENSVRNLLVNNAVYPVKFPTQAGSTHVNPESPPLPQEPQPPLPPPATELPIPPTPMYNAQQNMPLQWPFWYWSPPQNADTKTDNSGD